MSHVPDPEIRRILASSDRPEVPQQVCDCPSFRNGIDQNSQRSNANQGLIGQTRSERCLFFSPIISEVPQIQMERPNMAVQSTPLWSEQCSLCFHQVDETSSLHVKKVWDQIYSVS